MERYIRHPQNALRNYVCRAYYVHPQSGHMRFVDTVEMCGKMLCRVLFHNVKNAPQTCDDNDDDHNHHHQLTF